MKWIGKFFTVILLLLGIIVASVFFLPADRIARVAAQQISAQTGRNVNISGDVSMSLWPVIGISAGSVEVDNASWAKKGPMLTAQNAKIGVDVKALLSGEIRIKNIEATNPTIRLQTLNDGRANWEFSDETGEATISTSTSENQTPQAFSLQRMSIKNANLIYDAQGSDLVSYQGVDLSLDWPERLGPATIKARLHPNGADVFVDARIEGFAGFIAGQVQKIDANIRTNGGDVALNGRANLAGAVSGAVNLDLSSTDQFLRALALGGADLPKGLGQSIKMSSNMTLTENRKLSLRDLAVDLGGNKLNGAADVTLNGTPHINGQFTSNALDLSGAMQSDAGGSGGSESSGWSKANIDASGLAAFNGEISLVAGSIDLGDFKLGKSQLLLRNDNSRAVFELRKVQAYEGVVSGEFVMNNRKGLSVGGKIFASKISVQAVLRDGADIDKLTGMADAELSFLGVGSSVATIMNSLSGKGAVNMGRGTIEGIDLDALMGRGKTSGGTTVFDSMGASFTMKSGQMYNDNLLIKLPNFEARGKGRVGLGPRDIDYLFTPTALRANAGKGIAIPVRIKGSWDHPKIQPDLEAAIDLNLAEEKEKLKKKAKDKVKQKLEKELKLKVQDGQTVEDAVKQKVEKKLKNELLKIFD